MPGIRRIYSFAALLSAIALVAIASCGGDLAGLISGGDFLQTGRTLSFFTALQVDPRSEDSAGPQFVVAEDLNNDGLLDLISAWNQSQPVQIHLQSAGPDGSIGFETITLAGSIPAVAVSGLAAADFDGDGNQDVAVLLKESLVSGAACLDSEQPGDGLRGLIVIYFGPDDPTQANQALAWDEVQVRASLLQGSGDDTSQPESGGYTGLAIGDMDADGDLDIVTAWNSDCNGGTSAALVFTNNGPTAVRDGTWTGVTIPDEFPKGTSIKDVSLADIDLDGDLDIVATFPEAQTMNVRWYRNPTLDVPDDFHISDGQWQTGFVAQLATGADIARLADVDGDGSVDVVVRSTGGALIQWFRNPGGATTTPLRSIPWQVYTLAEFVDRTPAALAVGDITADGRLEVISSAGGGLAWFGPASTAQVFDQWIEHLIVDDEPPGSPFGGPATTDPNVTPAEVAGSTFINSILVVDLDGDGAQDIIATLDRSGLSGLSNDAIVWFRNTR